MAGGGKQPCGPRKRVWLRGTERSEVPVSSGNGSVPTITMGDVRETKYRLHLL